MYFSDAFRKVVNENGRTIVVDSKLIDLIESYHGFNDFPELKSILIAIQTEGFAKLLESVQSCQKDYADIAMALYNKYNFNPDDINRALDAFQYYLGDNDTTANEEFNLDDAWIDEYGVKYSYDKKRLLKADESLVNYQILPGTEIICKGAFNECYELKSICFPDGLTHIGEDAFYYCQDLSSVTFVDSIEFIGNSAFSNCRMLTSVVLPKKLKYLGSHAFSTCTKIESISIPYSLEYIGDYAFEDCFKLQSICLPQSLKYLGRNPFCGCRELTSVDCNSSFFKISNHAIYDKSGELLICYFGNDEEVVLPDGLVYIGAMALERKRQIKKINLPDSLIFIANFALRYCSSINEVIFPEKLIWIGEQAFNGCRGINQIEFLGNPKVTCDTALGSLDSLETIELPEGLEVLGHGTFFLCKNLRSVKLPNTLKHIWNVVFYGCESLESVNLPQSVLTFGEDVFKGCDLLSSITIPIGSHNYFEGLLSPEYHHLLVENNNYGINTHKDVKNDFRIKSLQRIEEELISEFTIDSMMGGQKEISHPDYSTVPSLRKLQAEYAYRCLSTKKFLLSDKAMPFSSDGFIAKTVKSKIYDYASNVSNRNCKALHEIYNAKEIHILAEQISMFAHYTLFEQTIDNMSIENNNDLTIDTEFVSSRIAFYVLFTIMVNKNVHIDMYDSLFVQAWFYYFDNWAERDNRILQRFNDMRQEYSDILRP